MIKLFSLLIASYNETVSTQIDSLQAVDIDRKVPVLQIGRNYLQGTTNKQKARAIYL